MGLFPSLLKRLLGRFRSPVAEARAPAEKWIDEVQLEQMNDWIVSRNPDYFRTALIQFEESYLRLTAKIQAACSENRFQDAGEAAHALKGICLTLGLLRMGEICRALEALGLGGSAPQWPKLLRELAAAKKPSLEEWRRWTNESRVSPSASN
jgi:HPt (histidine-containing phosphotransfer) domain-containing protein